MMFSKPGDTLRIEEDLPHGIMMKQICALIAGSSKPKINIGTHLLVLEWTKPASKGHPLLKLPEPYLIKLSLKLRLAHQDNLKQLFSIRLQIGEKSQVLENLVT